MKLTTAQQIKIDANESEAKNEFIIFKHYNLCQSYNNMKPLKETPKIDYKLFKIIYFMFKNKEQAKINDFLKIDSLKDDILIILRFCQEYHN